MKKILLFLLIVIAAVFFLRFLTPEDTWIKNKKGEWIKHGNPRSPKPTEKVTPTKKPTVRREELLGYCGVSSYGLCSYDTDCYITGCNSEICQSKNEEPILSACVILSCHKKPEGISCGCKEGECQWEIRKIN